MKATPLTFPKNFTWGVATAAPQIEGAAFTRGKCESTWDNFALLPGRVHNGDNLDVACDHYHRFDSDFALMAKLGIKNYRLSLAWPRIIPAADGKVNQAGLDFYHRLFDSMEKHRITPWVTMFHWDTPQYLEVNGGWRNRATAEAFGRYADVIVQAFGSRVKNWITLNEIRCFTIFSFSGNLDKAPGIRESAQVGNQTVHHAVLAHGYGVRAVRSYGGRGARVGLTDNLDIFVPVEETEKHIAAARSVFAAENDRILVRSSLMVFFPLASALALPPAIWAGLVGQESLWLAALGLPLMIAGGWLGTRMFVRYGGLAYRPIALAALAFTALASLARGLSGLLP